MTESHDYVPGCMICGHFANLNADAAVWRDDHWIASGMVDVPGWIMVATRRHSEGSWGLSDQEAAAMGSVLRTLTGALKEVTGAERVHLAAQGEHSLHFHYLMMARRPGDVPIFDSAELSRRSPALADPVQSAAVIASIRDLVG